MANENEILEFLEEDFAHASSSKMQRRRRLRVDCNPLDLEDAEFIKRHRLSKELAPFMKNPTKSTDLCVETKPSGSSTAGVELPVIAIPESMIPNQDSPASESILIQASDSLPAQVFQEVPSSSRTLSPTPPLSGRPAPPRRRRRKRETPLSREAARRSLIQSAETRAQATISSSQSLEAISTTLVDIKEAITELCNIQRRIERQPSSQRRGQFNQEIGPFGGQGGPFSGLNPMNTGGFQGSSYPYPGPGQGYQGPPIANVSPPPYGQPGHGMLGQTYPSGYPQSYPQNYPGQGYIQGQGYPAPGYPPHGYPGHGYPPQLYPGQGYPDPGQGQAAPQSGSGMGRCAACTACLTCLFCSCCQGLMGAAIGEGMDHEGEDEGPAASANVSPPPQT